MVEIYTNVISTSSLAFNEITECHGKYKNRRWVFPIHKCRICVSPNLLKMYQNFGEKYFIHIQGKKIRSQTSHQNVGKYLIDYTTTANSHSQKAELKSVAGTEGAGIATLSFTHYV